MEKLLESLEVPNELEPIGDEIPAIDLHVNRQSYLRCPEILQAEKTARHDRRCPDQRRRHYYGPEPHLERFVGLAAHLEDLKGPECAKDRSRKTPLVLHQPLEAG